MKFTEHKTAKSHKMHNIYMNFMKPEEINIKIYNKVKDMTDSYCSFKCEYHY